MSLELCAGKKRVPYLLKTPEYMRNKLARTLCDPWPRERVLEV